MMKIFGEFNIKGGFKVTSKHDLMTAVMSIVVLVGIVALTITGHDSSAAMTGLLAGLGGLFSYWFARGGSAMTQQSQPTQTDITSQVANGVIQGVQQISQTPAQGVVNNAAGVQGKN